MGLGQGRCDRPFGHDAATVVAGDANRYQGVGGVFFGPAHVAAAAERIERRPGSRSVEAVSDPPAAGRHFAEHFPPPCVSQSRPARRVVWVLSVYEQRLSVDARPWAAAAPRWGARPPATLRAVEESLRTSKAVTKDHPTIGIDAGPLTSGHGIRGIGRYVASLLEALAREESDWCSEHLGILVDGSADSTWPSERTWRAHRSTVRPQDLGWLTSAFLDRLAIRGSNPLLWHQTDPSSPFSPVPLWRTIATVYDLIPLRDPAVMRRLRPHRRIPYRIYLRNARKAGLVIAISETTALEVEEVLGVPAERVRVVYPAVVQLATPVATKASRREGEPAFLFVGVPDPHKRPDLAIDALAAFRRTNHAGRLSFIGFHPGRESGWPSPGRSGSSSYSVSGACRRPPRG